RRSPSSRGHGARHGRRLTRHPPARNDRNRLGLADCPAPRIVRPVSSSDMRPPVPNCVVGDFTLFFGFRYFRGSLILTSSVPCLRPSIPVAPNSLGDLSGES